MKDTLEDTIEKTLEKSFKEYSAVNFSKTSKNIVDKFIKECFIINLGKKMDLKKAYENSKTRDSELIGNIEQLLITNGINGNEETIKSLKELIRQYRSN
jgi:hypothetical protein